MTQKTTHALALRINTPEGLVAAPGALAMLVVDFSVPAEKSKPLYIGISVLPPGWLDAIEASVEGKRLEEFNRQKTLGNLELKIVTNIEGFKHITSEEVCVPIHAVAF